VGGTDTVARRVRVHLVDPSAFTPPYDRALARTVRTVARLRSTRDADRERGLRDGAAPALTVAARTLRSLRRK